VLNPKNPTDLPEAIGYFSKKEKEALLERDTLRAIEALRLIAIGQFNVGNYYDSEEAATEAVNLLELLKQSETVGNARIGLFNHLGNVYRNLENYEAALDIYHKALPLATQTRDSLVILNNMALVYKDQEQYANALAQYRLIASLHAADPDSLELARVVDNMGGVLSQLKEPSALDSLRKGLGIRLRKNDLNGLYASYKNLALYYHMQGDSTEALEYAQQAHRTARQINSPSFRYDALALLAQLNANADVNEYSRLTDSLTKARQLA
jgi:tetratricopeptide (TPR) repeat protein